MTTASVIGAGDLGGAVAHALASREGVDRVVLLDDHGSAAAGKALDIQQAGAIAGFHTRLVGTDDASRVIGSAAVIVADRFGGGGEWQGEAGLARMLAIAGHVGAAPVIFAGTTQAPLLRASALEAGYDRSRVLGSAPEALASAVKAIVAMEARCGASEVMLSVLGTPPYGFVVPWSEASIGGYALDRMLSAVQLARLEARTPRLWPPQPYALGLAAAVLAEAAVHSSRRAFSALTLLDGEFGVRDAVGALPVLLSPRGIVHRRVPTLSTRERTQVETALAG